MTLPRIDQNNDEFLDLAFGSSNKLDPFSPYGKCVNTRQHRRQVMSKKPCVEWYMTYTMWVHHCEHERARAEVLRHHIESIDGTRFEDTVHDYRLP